MAVFVRGAQAAVLILATLSCIRVEAYNATRPPCPCQNGGICLPTGRGDGTTFCRCNLNPRIGATFRGASCESQSHECGNQHFCLHSGMCVSGGCDCSAGFSGDKCQVDDSSAHVSVVTSPTGQRAPCPCQNGGQCLLIPANGQHVCKCVAPWVGASCRVDSNTAFIDAPPPPPPPNLGPPCPCGNGGECVRTAQGKPVCKCRAPWIGASCRVDSETVSGASPSKFADKTLSQPEAELPRWAVAVIVIGTLGLIALGAFVYILVSRERAGRPFFFTRPSGFRGFLSGKGDNHNTFNSGGVVNGNGSISGGGIAGGNTGGNGNQKRQFSCGGDIEKSSPFSSRAIPIQVNSTPPSQRLSKSPPVSREVGGGRNMAVMDFGDSPMQDRATPLAAADAERFRLEQMMTEIATIVSEKDNYEYDDLTDSGSEDEVSPSSVKRYHEMGLSSPASSRRY